MTVFICQVEQEDLIPSFKKAGINGQSLIELMHLQINSPDYLYKALMEHIGIGEYGRVLSFSMYVQKTGVPWVLDLRLGPVVKSPLPPSGIRPEGGHVCVNAHNEVEQKICRDQAVKEGDYLCVRGCIFCVYQKAFVHMPALSV